MARGGAREGAGRKNISPELPTKRIVTRVPENIDDDIELLGMGKSKAEKIRYILEIGLRKIKEENEKNQSN